MKRAKVIALALIFGIVCLNMRILYLAVFNPQTVNASNHYSTEEYGTNRGLIFDCSMRPIVETSSKNIHSLENLSFTYPLKQRYSDSQLCEHLIGYTDADNCGLTGIEKDFDAYLKAIPNYVAFNTYRDARGTVLKGKGTEADTSHICTDSGIALTVDSRVQTIIEAAESSVKKGSIVVMNASSGGMLASASFPSFNPNDIGAALRSSQAPLINRALSQYNVGSVFKIVICIAALENGVSAEQHFYCRGFTQCAGVKFHCHNTQGHGKVDMKEAIAHSCNVYFIKMAQYLGYEKIMDTCEKLKLTREYCLSASITVPGFRLPTLKETGTGAGLANFSFGQGELLASPVALARVYAIIANGGLSVEPHILKAKVMHSNEQVFEHPKTERVVSKQTASVLQELLRYTVTDGTGKNAQCEMLDIAGKTATAQTGKYENGREILISYFVGYFSIKEDVFVVLVMCEGGSSGSADCAPVFQRIATQMQMLFESDS